MTFAYPFLLLFPLVFLLLYIFTRKKSSAIAFPSVSMLNQLPIPLKVKLRKPLLSLLTLIFICLVSLGAARPQKTSTEEAPQDAYDLMLVLDISGSMKERDFRSGFRYVNRLDAVKEVVSKFIDARKGDRIGLSVFGTQAFLQSPLTSDHRLVLELLSLLQIGIAGEGTAIGDGLGVALKSLEDIPGKSKAIVLLTDGSNNSGQVSPLQAASIAQKFGIKVHTIGIGNRGDNRQLSMFNQPAEYDEKTLKEISSMTGGVFFNANDIEGLKDVYSEIDKLEMRSKEEPRKIVLQEYFPRLAMGALVSLLTYMTLNATILLKIPE